MSQEANRELRAVCAKVVERGFKASVDNVRLASEGEYEHRLIVKGDRFDTPLFVDLEDVWAEGEDASDILLDSLMDHLAVAKELRRLGWFAQVESAVDIGLGVVVYDRSGRTSLIDYEIDGIHFMEAEIREIAQNIIDELVDGGHAGACVGVLDTETGDLFIPTGTVSDPDPERTVAEASEEDLLD